MNDTGSAPDGSDLFSHLIANLYLVYLPLCVVLGLTGNTMVWILIKSNRLLSKLPTNTYLLCLASMSSLFLVFLLLFWLEEVSYRYFNVFHIYLFKNSNLSCKMNTFLAHVCDFASVWLIVLVGCERLVLLYWNSRTLTKERARTQIAFLIGVAMLFNSWILGVASINEKNHECDINEQFATLYNVMTLLETVVCMAVPSIIIILSNVLVVYKLNSHLRRHPSSPGVSFNTADVVMTTASSLNSQQTTRASMVRASGRYSEDAQRPMVKKAKKGLRYADIQLTRSLMVVTWVFIILNLPNYLYRITTTVFGVPMQSDLMQRISWFVHVLLYTHHAFLFYLYIFHSPQMKRRLKPTALRLLECYCFKPAGEHLTES